MNARALFALFLLVALCFLVAAAANAATICGHGVKAPNRMQRLFTHITVNGTAEGVPFSEDFPVSNAGQEVDITPLIATLDYPIEYGATITDIDDRTSEVSEPSGSCFLDAPSLTNPGAEAPPVGGDPDAPGDAP